MKIKPTIFYLCCMIIMVSCGTSKEKQMHTTSNNHQTLTGQIVKKEFINKAGKPQGFYEYYLRCSIQDYFIKFCESKVTKTEIDALNLGQFDAITVEAEIKEGEWDVCHGWGTSIIPTRIGNYVVIYKVL